MLKRFLLFVLMLALCFAGGAVAFSSTARQSALSMTIVPDKPVVSAGAPLTFKMIFTNSGGEAVRLLAGTEAFTISLFDSHSRMVCQNQEQLQGGLSIIRRYEIAPGKAAEGKYLLNRWCSTLIKSGHYTLLVEFKDIGHPDITLTAKCQFKVAPPNSEELRQALSQAAVTISDNHASWQERSIAIDVLRFSRDSESIEFIRPILSDKQIEGSIKEPLVKGLVLIDTVNAARLIMEVYAESASSPELQRTALCALQDLDKKTKSSAVRASLKKFMQEHWRPCPKIID